MRRMLLVPVALALLGLSAPASAFRADVATPYGREDNALGTLRWLPDNANERSKVPANQFRLVVVYDYSLDAEGKSIPLKGKGPFGLKFFTTSQADFKMKGHSASVGDLKTLSGRQEAGPADELAAGVYGDVRDGACSKLGTPAFSAAYSTTRTFFHPGTEPYAAQSGPGACEKVDASVEVRDPGTGELTGFTTTVTTHVPGFWIDAEWPTRTIPQVGTGRVMAEVWYGAAYDDDGDPGPFPNGLDTTGASKSVGGPGDYDYVFSFGARPGGFGPACPGVLPGVPDDPATFQDVKVQIPEGTTRVIFKLFPKGDWDLRVIDPEGKVGDSGQFVMVDETETVPSTGSGNIPKLVPGEFTMRACNYTGEPTVMGAVIIQ